MTNTSILSIGHLETNYGNIRKQDTWISNRVNAFEDVVCKMSAITFKPQNDMLTAVLMRYTILKYVLHNILMKAGNMVMYRFYELSFNTITYHQTSNISRA